MPSDNHGLRAELAKAALPAAMNYVYGNKDAAQQYAKSVGITGGMWREDLCAYLSLRHAEAVLARLSNGRTGANVPPEAICIFKDGDAWCAVHGDFENLQESPAGFGETFMDAISDLRKNSEVPDAQR